MRVDVHLQYLNKALFKKAKFSNVTVLVNHNCHHSLFAWTGNGILQSVACFYITVYIPLVTILYMVCKCFWSPKYSYFCWPAGLLSLPNDGLPHPPPLGWSVEIFFDRTE